jgi:ACS family tartrate transporter-like MFS transporter
MTCRQNRVSDPPPASGVAEAAETAVMAKVTRRLIPFLVACYLTAYLDRVNISFAALSMNADLGLSAALFGWGAGIFFIGYALFEVPSNYILHRVGARRWIARIMVSFGILSGAMAAAFNPASFLVLRGLLGIAEAGFFPGILLYLSYWIPAAYRARSLAAFLLAVPVATVIGAPLSGLLLASMDGMLGLAGWRWLFIVEALPSIILGILAFIHLTDRPGAADWLTPKERAWLEARMAREQASFGQDRAEIFWLGMRDPRVILLSLAYFGIVCAHYGLGLWLPQIVHGFGFGPIATGFFTAIPYAIGGIAMILWSRSCDRTGERHKYAALAAVLAAFGLATAAWLTEPPAILLALTLATAGSLAAMPAFWTLPMAFLSQAAAAAGIALINAIGNLAGFFGPLIIGMVKQASGEFSFAMLALAAGPAAAAILILALKLQFSSRKCR